MAKKKEISGQKYLEKRVQHLSEFIHGRATGWFIIQTGIALSIM